jgi:membrane protein DedA with SNARE-associated domain
MAGLVQMPFAVWTAYDLGLSPADAEMFCWLTYSLSQEIPWTLLRTPVGVLLITFIVATMEWSALKARLGKLQAAPRTILVPGPRRPSPMHLDHRIIP